MWARRRCQQYYWAKRDYQGLKGSVLPELPQTYFAVAFWIVGLRYQMGSIVPLNEAIWEGLDERLVREIGSKTEDIITIFKNIGWNGKGGRLHLRSRGIERHYYRLVKITKCRKRDETRFKEIKKRAKNQDIHSLSSGRFIRELCDWAGGGLGDQNKQVANVMVPFWARSHCNCVDSEATLKYTWLNWGLSHRNLYVEENWWGEVVWASPNWRQWLSHSPTSWSMLASHLPTFFTEITFTNNVWRSHGQLDWLVVT